MGAEESVSDLECQEEICKLKTNIMKAHTYSQGQWGHHLQLVILCVWLYREQREEVLAETGREEEVYLLHPCQRKDKDSCTATPFSCSSCSSSPSPTSRHHCSCFNLCFLCKFSHTTHTHTHTTHTIVSLSQRRRPLAEKNTTNTRQLR